MNYIMTEDCMRRILSIVIVAVSCLGAAAQVTVFPSEELGPVKEMNSVNNAPRITDGELPRRGGFEWFSEAGIGFSRNHDAAFESGYGAEHVVDISAVFPDFSRDPEDPQAYDFTLTDRYVRSVMNAGTQVFYRLGQKIEHSPKKYGIYPPADYSKWASVAEHIIRHYNEGWADGYRWNLAYWEIWNEPDLDWKDDRWKTDPRTWGGDAALFFDFYECVAKHLKKSFPSIKIGGPAMAGSSRTEMFAKEMAKRGVPLDFYSWHRYGIRPSEFADRAVKVRKILDDNGYGATESILNEWNYVKDWNEGFAYSVESIHSIRGGAFMTAVMSACQVAPVDMLMYYDLRPSTYWNGVFDFYTGRPLPGYYALFSWGKLKDMGTAVKANSAEDDVFVTAARGTDGRLGILVTRYNESLDVVSLKKVNVRLDNGAFKKVRCHLTDAGMLFSEYPVRIAEDGSVNLVMEACSFVFIETE